MARTVRSRLLSLVPILLFISFLTFALLQLMPGSPAAVILGQDATGAQIADLNRRLGLDHPLIVQYLDWLSHLLRGNLGSSLVSGQSVTSLISSRLPVTLSLASLGMILAVTLGLGLGIAATVRPDGKVSRAVDWFTAFGLAVPGFWLAILLAIPFALWLKILPATGYVALTQNPLEWFRSIILGSAALSAAPAAAIARHTRASLQAVLSQDFVRAARARGLSANRTLLKHALRNALVPVVTVVGFHFATLLGGALVVEQIFGLNGIGQLAIASIQGHDIPVVQGVVFFAGLVVVSVNLLTDLLYALIDPRVRAS